MEPLVQDLKVFDSVDAVDGGGQAIFGVKGGGFITLPQKGGEVEIILREHDPYRFDRALNDFISLEFFIFDRHDTMLLYGLTDFPKTFSDRLTVMWLYVVIFFIGDEFCYGPFTFFGDAAGNEFI